MKAVLMSIKPKWCELIESGRKTVELRKTKPKLETPFKVYIYETQGYSAIPQVYEDGRLVFKGRGSIIGEFVCDCIATVLQCNSGWVQENARVTGDEFFDYLGICRDTHFGYDKKAYGWHISGLVIYDQPKELSEFVGLRKTKFGYEPNKIIRPPQSWMYVEELE